MAVRLLAVGGHYRLWKTREIGNRSAIVLQAGAIVGKVYPWKSGPNLQVTRLDGE